MNHNNLQENKIVPVFNYDYYSYFITELQKTHDFTSFSRVKYSRLHHLNKILLRHDVDQSLSKALEMARIEKELGIISTYFLFLKSPFYNVFSQSAEKMIYDIISLDHNIGLHFDYNLNHARTLSNVSYRILEEVEIIQRYFGVKLDAVSFHRPLNIDLLQKIELNSLPHTYESIFLNDFKYFSDSRGRWRFGDPLSSDDYKSGRDLHILIHPIWWNSENLTPKESIESFQRDYFNNYKDNIHSELKGFWDEQD